MRLNSPTAIQNSEFSASANYCGSVPQEQRWHADRRLFLACNGSSNFERCIVVVSRMIFYFVSISRFMSDEDRVFMVPSHETKTETETRGFHLKFRIFRGRNHRIPAPDVPLRDWTPWPQKAYAAVSSDSRRGTQNLWTSLWVLPAQTPMQASCAYHMVRIQYLQSRSTCPFQSSINYNLLHFNSAVNVVLYFHLILPRLQFHRPTQSSLIMLCARVTHQPQQTLTQRDLLQIVNH